MSFAATRVVLTSFSVAVLAVVGCAGGPTSPGASASGTLAASATPRAGDLHVTKDCTNTYQGQAGDFCTITSSTLDAIDHSRVVYNQAADLTTFTLDSDIVVDPPEPGNNLVFGHCRVDLATGVGLCTLSGGTGKFAQFHARVDVSPAQPQGFFVWDGTYSFSPDE